MSAQTLTNWQVATARDRWSRGWTLAEIAAYVRCSVYDLSPWIYSDAMARADDERDRRSAALNQKEN